MKKYLCAVPLALLLCFAFSCKQGEEVAAEKEAEPAIIVDTAISADGIPISCEVRGGVSLLLFLFMGGAATEATGMNSYLILPRSIR